MSLTWRKIADEIVSGTAVSNFLDAIYTALTATTYTNGDTRTAGSGRAWTVGSKITSAGTTEALQITSPAGKKLLIAGSASAKTPKMYSTDTWLSSGLHIGMSPNGGTLTTWDATGSSDPLGSSAYFSGFARFCAAISASGKVCVYEAVEGLCVMVKTSTSWYGFVAGSIIDPGATGSLISETSGYCYGMFVAGSTAISTSMISSSTQVFCGVNGGSAGNARGLYWLPRTSTIRSISRSTNSSASLSSANNLKLADDSYILLPMPYKDTTSEYAVGYLRGFRIGPLGTANTTALKSGSTDYAYKIGGSDTGSTECYYLLTGL